jgi:hypothetical protein
VENIESPDVQAPNKDKEVTPPTRSESPATKPISGHIDATDTIESYDVNAKKMASHSNSKNVTSTIHKNATITNGQVDGIKLTGSALLTSKKGT